MARAWQLKNDRSEVIQDSRFKRGSQGPQEGGEVTVISRAAVTAAMHTAPVPHQPRGSAPDTLAGQAAGRHTLHPVCAASGAQAALRICLRPGNPHRALSVEVREQQRLTFRIGCPWC
eukprot:352946-Chlamydomonas_euryale.AAC.2